jgi:hypothetical protein
MILGKCFEFFCPFCYIFKDKEFAIKYYCLKKHFSQNDENLLQTKSLGEIFHPQEE